MHSTFRSSFRSSLLAAFLCLCAPLVVSGQDKTSAINLVGRYESRSGPQSKFDRKLQQALHSPERSQKLEITADGKYTVRDTDPSDDDEGTYVVTNESVTFHGRLGFSAFKIIDNGKVLTQPSGFRYVRSDSTDLTASPEPALILAARQDDLAQVKALVKKGADINVRAHDGGATPLLSAATHGTPEMVAFLLDKKASINAQNNQGGTALFLAARFGHTEIVKLLIARGANVNIRTKPGNTALSSAIKYHYTAIVKMLKNAGAKE